MAGSSVRNALHRRNHKERAQLVGRSRLGLLEKKKDYVERARDYHSKQDRIRRLQEKAAMRNKDEFYFSMVNSTTKGGVHVKSRGNVAIPVDTVKLLKSQDENYIRTMRASGLKKIAALKLELSTLVNLLSADPSASQESDDDDDDLELADSERSILQSAGLLPSSFSSSSSNSRSFSLSRKRKRIDDPAPALKGSRIVFVDSPAEAKAYKSSHQKASNPSPSSPSGLDAEEDEEVDLGWNPVQDLTSSKKRRKGKAKANAAEAEAQKDIAAREARKAASDHRTQLLRELAARLQRDAQLRDSLLEIQNQRLRMQNGSKRLVASPSNPSSSTASNSKTGGGFTFNMGGSDDEDEGGNGEGSDEDSDGERDANGEKKWKPKVFKWKFERSR